MIKKGNAECDVCGVSVCPSPQLPHLQDVSGRFTLGQAPLKTQRQPLLVMKEKGKVDVREKDNIPMISITVKTEQDP